MNHKKKFSVILMVSLLCFVCLWVWIGFGFCIAVFLGIWGIYALYRWFGFPVLQDDTLDETKQWNLINNKVSVSTALFMCLIVSFNLILLFYSYRSNERAKQLFVGQNKPLIDVTPISIALGVSEGGTKMVTTGFSIVNYSGFVASNIAIDVKYGKTGNWISEWVKADDDNKKEKKGVVFLSTPKVLIKELKPGKTMAKDFKGKLTLVSGALDLEKTVCNAGRDGYPVFVRVRWENKRRHVFDEIHEYTLLCTEKDLGRAFTFIPEGIESQKD